MTGPRLRFDDVGDGPVVVLIHGHPFDRSMWEPQRAQLSESFRVIAPDLRGYGQSAATAGLVTMAELAGDVEALLDDLGIADAAVVGLSMGGLVAMELAIADPRRWWALGLVATTAEPIVAEERRDRLALADRLDAEGIEPAVQAMTPRLFGPLCPQPVIDDVVAMMRRANPIGAAAALRGRAQRPDYKPGLAALRLPVFVCTGTDDSFSTSEITASLVAALHDPEVVSLAGVGHLPNLERPDEFNAALVDFLTRANTEAVT